MKPLPGELYIGVIAVIERCAGLVEILVGLFQPMLPDMQAGELYQDDKGIIGVMTSTEIDIYAFLIHLRGFGGVAPGQEAIALVAIDDAPGGLDIDDMVGIIEIAATGIVDKDQRTVVIVAGAVEAVHRGIAFTDVVEIGLLIGEGPEIGTAGPIFMKGLFKEMAGIGVTGLLIAGHGDALGILRHGTAVAEREYGLPALIIIEKCVLVFLLILVDLAFIQQHLGILLRVTGPDFRRGQDLEAAVDIKHVAGEIVSLIEVIKAFVIVSPKPVVYTGCADRVVAGIQEPKGLRRWEIE